jgi:hypothetical protein
MEDLAGHAPDYRSGGRHRASIEPFGTGPAAPHRDVPPNGRLRGFGVLKSCIVGEFLRGDTTFESERRDAAGLHSPMKSARPSTFAGPFFT